MADQVVREFTIRVNAKGQIEAIKGFEKLDDSIEKTNHSMGENDRKQKAVAQATSNTTKAFAKQAQGLGGVVRIYATVAANVFALSSAYNLLKRNADLEILRRSSEQLSVSTGSNYNLIADQLRKVTGGAIDFRTAMQSANLALSGGLSGTQATQITEIATKAANALGRSVPEAVQRLTQAIVKGEPELADEFGIILRVTEATNEYARSLGKLPTQLTTAQKQQAIFNQFLEQGTEKFANVEIQTNPYDKLAASFIELSNSVVSLIRLPLDPFVKLVSESGIALAGIFAGIAGGIAKLLLPELNKLSAKMVEVAQANQVEARADRSAALQNQAVAQKKVNAELYDYFEILRSGKNLTVDSLKNIKLGKGIDSKQFAEELLDKNSFGTEIRSNILKSIFDGDERQMRTVVGRFARDLGKEIERASAKGEYRVSFKGYEGTIQEARIAVETLGIAWRSTKQLEEDALGSAEARASRYKNKIDSIRSSVKLLGADIKLATSVGYASGLEKGFLKSLFGIKTTFKDISTEVGGGLRGKIIGLFGSGSKLAGGFLGSITKLAGVFGQWGFAISILTTAFGPLIDYLNLTDKNFEKIVESLEKYDEVAATTETSIERLGKKAVKSYEDQVDAAKMAGNIVNTINTNVQNLQETFLLLDNTQDSFWRYFNDNAEQAAQAILRVSKATKQVLDLAPKSARADIAARNTSFEVDTAFGDTGTLGDINVRGKLLKKEDLLERLKKDLEGTGATPFLKGDRIAIKVPLDISAEQAEAIARASTVRGAAIIRASDLYEGQREGLKAVSKDVKETTDSVTSFDQAYRDFSKTLSDNATKVNGASREYAGASNVIEKFNTIVEKNALSGVSETMSSLTPQMTAIIAKYSELGAAADKATPEQAVEAFKKYRDELARFATASSNASAEQARLNAKLVSVNDSVSRGDTAQLTQQYKLQSELIDSQVKALQAKSDEASLNLDILKSEGKDSEVVRQKTAERAKIESEILALKAKQSTIYSQDVANEKIMLASAKSRAKVASLNLKSVQERSKVSDAIAKITGDTSDLANRLDYEGKILKAKLAQLAAAAASKRADAAAASGDKAATLNKEAAVIEQQVKLQKTLGNIRIEQLAKSQREIGINLDNKKAETAIELSKIQLSLDQKRADIAADNKFSTTALRDVAELNSLKKQVALTEQDTLLSQQKVTKLTANIKSEETFIAGLRSRGLDITERTVKLQELKLDRSIAEKEAAASIAETEEKILELKERQFEQDKKNADIFRDPQEFGALLGEQFRRAAEEFGEAMGNSINRIVDITLGTIDAGVDAFVDAVRNGEDVLTATKEALGNTFLELNTQLIKDVFKNNIREGLAAIFPSLKNIGKSEETIAQEKGNTYLAQIAANTAKTPIPGGNPQQQQQQQQQGMFTNITSFFKDTFAKVKDVFTNVGTNISSVVTDAVSGISDFIGGIDLGGIFDSISSLFSGFGGGSFGGGGGTDIAGIAQTAISLFLAKGGITGEIQKRIPMYANGTVTSGPELAMIGEGPKREAVVPLPDNRSIPVTIYGDQEKANIVENKISVNVNGVQGTEEGLRRSANQIALEIGRSQSRAQGRIG